MKDDERGAGQGLVEMCEGLLRRVEERTRHVREDSGLRHRSTPHGQAVVTTPTPAPASVRSMEGAASVRSPSTHAVKPAEDARAHEHEHEHENENEHEGGRYSFVRRPPR